MTNILIRKRIGDSLHHGWWRIKRNCLRRKQFITGGGKMLVGFKRTVEFRSDVSLGIQRFKC